MIYSSIIFGLTTLLAISSPAGFEASGGFFLGKATYYSRHFEGKKTAFGEVFRNKYFTAAHRTLPHNTLLEVVNVKNGKNVVVRVNDRGPWQKHRLIDISQAAAQKLGIIKSGIGEVKVRVVGAEGRLFEHEKECLSEVLESDSR